MSYPAVNVHNLGWFSAGTVFRIEFESTSTSDPQAILISNTFQNRKGEGELVWSDDEGGQMNPYFQVTKPYHAAWILSVTSADSDPACYTYRVTVVSGS